MRRKRGAVQSCESSEGGRGEEALGKATKKRQYLNWVLKEELKEAVPVGWGVVTVVISKGRRKTLFSTHC